MAPRTAQFVSVIGLFIELRT